MKKITKLLLMTAIAIGMVSCSNDDNLPDAPDANAAKGNTYASISIKLPKGPSTRAGLPGDYNDKGTWEGIDAINDITVFLVNETSGSESIDFESFTKDSFDGIDSQGILFPKLALKATEGHKVKAYVVLNGNSGVLTTLEGTAPGDFAGVYETAVVKNASDLASNNGTNDVIMMTNTVAPAEMTVKAGVTESEAMTGSGNNTFMVEVERVVSRAIVTINSRPTVSAPIEFQMKDAHGVPSANIKIIDLKYVVGQSNNQFYMIKRDNYVTPDPVYSHVPSTSVTWNPNLFDNTGLEISSDVLIGDITELEATFKLEKKASKFVLPVTHEVTDEFNNYRKGNTTYFEIIATFWPDVYADTYSPGTDVFLGMKDGRFYKTRALAEAEGQKATHYKGDGNTTDGGAIMKYVLWLNPDVIPGTPDKKATMSPTVRNQVYHAHITGFKQIGLPNNPLNPDDPNSNFPENPINPIKPEDPLQTEDTYLSVQITVVPWGIHSYEIELGNDY
ncbi:MAG TPA: Mfa1 family fimbria major subunit [Dysgonamonadaceae bacterium]|nr:Mfa1 family fimbria major subunit [Dysgonamonadaceae bacterium]